MSSNGTSASFLYSVCDYFHVYGNCPNLTAFLAVDQAFIVLYSLSLLAISCHFIWKYTFIMAKKKRPSGGGGIVNQQAELEWTPFDAASAGLGAGFIFKIAYHTLLMSTSNPTLNISYQTMLVIVIQYIDSSLLMGSISSLIAPLGKLTLHAVKNREDPFVKLQGVVMVSYVSFISLACTVINILGLANLIFVAQHNGGLILFNFWRTVTYLAVPISFLISQIPLLFLSAVLGTTSLRKELMMVNEGRRKTTTANEGSSRSIAGKNSGKNNKPAHKRAIVRRVEAIIIFWMFYPIAYILLIYCISSVWWINTYFPQNSTFQLVMKILNGLIGWMVEIGFFLATMDAGVKSKVINRLNPRTTEMPDLEGEEDLQMPDIPSLRSAVINSVEVK